VPLAVARPHHLCCPTPPALLPWPRRPRSRCPGPAGLRRHIPACSAAWPSRPLSRTRCPSVAPSSRQLQKVGASLLWFPKLVRTERAGCIFPVPTSSPPATAPLRWPSSAPVQDPFPKLVHTERTGCIFPVPTSSPPATAPLRWPFMAPVQDRFPKLVHTERAGCIFPVPTSSPPATAPLRWPSRAPVQDPFRSWSAQNAQDADFSVHSLMIG
jgi:hypothetical protein